LISVLLRFLWFQHIDDTARWCKGSTREFGSRCQGSNPCWAIDIMNNFRSIILAAGKGTRMKSDVPKVLHQVCGRPMIEYVLDITRSLRSLKTYVVTGHGADLVQQTIGSNAEFVLQPQLLGTADAVRRVEPNLRGFKGTILVLCGDTPLLSQEIIKKLLAQHRKSKAVVTVLTALIDNPQGYGRIIRDTDNSFLAIREQKDVTDQEEMINEINVGVYCFESKNLFEALKKVRLNPKKKEFYLTDIIELFLQQGHKVDTLVSKDPLVAFGVNNRADLAQAEAIIRRRILDWHMANGVTIIDPATTYIESGVKIGYDTVVYPCTVIHSDVEIGSKCKVGPFARIRAGSRLADKVEIGNFAEVSRTTLGSGVFMKHFSFLGDANIGARVNIGAGVVTANYDGIAKNKTIVDEGAFIGSDSILVAPVTIGSKAIVGAGAVVTKNTKVPPKSVARGVPAKIFKQ
jgi:bifunctional UDP-N-acetylglucosamine pyrophosphorylase/glucosamine-1-phosphate N-acetyltransferase